MVILIKMAILILHTIDDAKLKILSKFQQKRMIFHRDNSKIRKTKEISADSVRKTIEYTKRTKETSSFLTYDDISFAFFAEE